MTASEENRMDEFFEAAKAVEEILRTNKDFGELMNHPKMIKENKVRIVEETFGGKIPKEMVGLMVLMVTKGRTNEMLSVFHHFINLVKEEKKIGTAHILTAFDLNKEQRMKVEQRLLETTRYESLETHYMVDESLIGGMKIRIGDWGLDSTIKSRLQGLTRELRNIQV